MCVGSVIAIGVGIAFCAASFSSIFGGVLLGAGAGKVVIYALALRILAGGIAASTEALYDLSSYLLSKLLSMFN